MISGIKKDEKRKQTAKIVRTYGDSNFCDEIVIFHTGIRRYYLYFGISDL